MKRYNSFVGYFKEKYGCRLQKIVIDAGFTCPNRDGKVDVSDLLKMRKVLAKKDTFNYN